MLSASQTSAVVARHRRAGNVCWSRWHNPPHRGSREALAPSEADPVPFCCHLLLLVALLILALGTPEPAGNLWEGVLAPPSCLWPAESIQKPSGEKRMLLAYALLYVVHRHVVGASTPPILVGVGLQLLSVSFLQATDMLFWPATPGRAASSHSSSMSHRGGT